MQFSLAYGFTQAEVTEDSEIPVGARLPGVPDHAFNIWLKYVIREGALKGLGAGFGTTYYSSQAVDYDLGGTLPAYRFLNAAIYYQRDQFKAQINFNNLADKRHFVGGGSDLYNIMASVGWEF